MAGYLTTHVLDTASGRPAEGLNIDLVRIVGDARVPITSLKTNADGRTDEPILPTQDFETGSYELVFHAADYLARQGISGTGVFLTDIPIRFTMSEASHYHVPLLLSPYGYSTYRGS